MTRLFDFLIRFLDKSVWRVVWTVLRRIRLAPMRQRAACVPVRLHDGSVEALLIESAKHPGTFVFPGGGVDAGETAEIAAARELLEEAGVGGARISPIGDYADAASMTKTHVFMVLVDQIYDTWLESASRGRRRQWFSIDALEQVLSQKGVHRHMLLLLREQQLTPASF